MPPAAASRQTPSWHTCDRLLDEPLNHVTYALFAVLHGEFHLILLNLFDVLFMLCCDCELLQKLPVFSVMSSPFFSALIISSFKAFILTLQSAISFSTSEARD